jgi:hypothetical protein
LLTSLAISALIAEDLSLSARYRYHASQAVKELDAHYVVAAGYGAESADIDRT